MLTVENLSIHDNSGYSITELGICLPPGSLIILNNEDSELNKIFFNILSMKSKPICGEILFGDTPVEEDKDYLTSILHYTYENFAVHHMTLMDYLRITAEKHDTLLGVEAAIRYFQIESYLNSALRTLPEDIGSKAQLCTLLLIPKPIWFLENPFQYLEGQDIKLLANLIASRCNQHGIVIVSTDKTDIITPLQILDLKNFLSMNSLNMDSKLTA